MSLRPELVPGKPDPAQLDALTRVIDALVDALDASAPTDALMAEHNRITGRTDIPAARYDRLYAAMRSEEAAREALWPEARKVPDITQDELEDIARRIIDIDTYLDDQGYYLALFCLNTPSGDSDLFFWPDAGWVQEIGTDTPSPAQIVARAMRDTSIRL